MIMPSELRAQSQSYWVKMLYRTLMQKHVKLRTKKKGSFFPFCSHTSPYVTVSPRKRRIPTPSEEHHTNKEQTYQFPTHRWTSLHDISKHLFKLKTSPRFYITWFCVSHPYKKNFRFPWWAHTPKLCIQKRHKAGFTWMKKSSLNTIGEFKTPTNYIQGGVGRTANILYKFVLNTWNNLLWLCWCWCS